MTDLKMKDSRLVYCSPLRLCHYDCYALFFLKWKSYHGEISINGNNGTTMMRRTTVVDTVQRQSNMTNPIAKTTE
jgi:hypothetical protein